MSQSYPIYPRSSFPEDIDAFEYMNDISESTLTAATAYNTYINQGNFEAAEKVRNDNPALEKCLFNADKHNKLLDAIMAMETLFSNDIHTYIRDIIKYRGLYSSTTSYKKYNVVTYVIEDVPNPFIAIADVPLKTPPTNTTYWQPLAIKGDQGISGIGLSPRGQWKPTVTYYKDDLVTHGDKWYVANSNLSAGIEPSTTSEFWTVFFDLSEILKQPIAEVDSKVQKVEESLSTHSDTIASSSSGIHGIRYDESTSLLMRKNQSGNWVEIETGGGFVAQASAPTKTNKLWIDTANGGIIKFHNGTSWVAVSAVWG